MKEATGETSMTMVTIAAIAVIAAILALLWPNIQNWIVREFNQVTTEGNKLNTNNGKQPNKIG